MHNIVIFGAGPHALVVIDILEEMGSYNIVGIIDSKLPIGDKVNGYEVIGRQGELQKLLIAYDFAGGIVCVGDNYWRKYVVNEILDQIHNFRFVNAIHPSVVISKTAKLGHGNVIMPGVIVNTAAIIGDHCIINTNSSLEHYCIMEDFSSLSAGVTTGGYTEIGYCSAVALGVTLFDRIKVGKHTVVGSGALVTKDIPDHVLSYGIPARVIRKRKEGEKYLK